MKIPNCDEEVQDGLTLTIIVSTDPVIRRLGERLVQAFDDEERNQQMDKAAETS